MISTYMVNQKVENLGNPPLMTISQLHYHDYLRANW